MYSKNEIIQLIKTRRRDLGEIYDYSLLCDVASTTKPITIICNMHGIFTQMLRQHLRNGGCPTCNYRKLTKDIFLQKLKLNRTDKGEYYSYELLPDIIGNNKCKIDIICKHHGVFTQIVLDHLDGHGCRKCAENNKMHNIIVKYGVRGNFAVPHIKDKIEKTMIQKYGVANASQNETIKQKKKDTCNINYGSDYYLQSNVGKEKIKQTILDVYGVEFISQHTDIKQKIMQTKIKNGSFTQSNSSKIATDYFRSHIIKMGYSSTQVAYADKDNNFYEWGYQVAGKWILFDFVAFEDGFRGNKDKIIEFHGPFHYNIEDYNTRPNDMAFPWKSKTTSIKASYELDRFKENFAKSLTHNYKIVWYNNL